MSWLLVLSIARLAQAGSEVQVQLDLFDVASPGAGIWVDRIVTDSEQRPVWQMFVAVGTFDRYVRGELAAVGWGRGAERRAYGRVGAHAFVWKGGFVGAHVEGLWRRVREPGAEARARSITPTVQPAAGWQLQPWGYEAGRAGLMVWIAPRIPFVRETLTVGGADYAIPTVEFASGLNLTVGL